MDDFTIGLRLLTRIRRMLDPGCVILELGSGTGTGLLARDYRMVSIEHDTRWLNLHQSHYIHAPIVGNWYDIVTLHRELPGIDYDLILVDGPPGYIGREPFLQHLNLFKLDVPIIVDDVHRGPEMRLLECLAARLSLQYEIVREVKTRKSFGVIP